MEKIRHLIRPDEFGSLKVVKNTLEFIRLEGDVRDRSRLHQVLARLDAQCLKLEGFASTLKVRAVETKDDFPTRHSWDSYFRDAKHMNELKAGERPDTIHITGLPVKWFTEGDSENPSEALIKKIFNKWGTVRRIDVPAADPYRSRMRLGQNIQKFSFEDGLFFDAYIQYIEYMDFVQAMDALRGMKLLKKEEKNYLTTSIKVDFDKTKHMSDNSVSHRAFERKRLIAQDNLAAEKLRKHEELENKRKEEIRKKEEADMIAKELRRKNREEKRKRNCITVFRKQEEDKVSMKIAREERKLIKAQRQLESIRLLDELFDRIKLKIEKKEIEITPRRLTDNKSSTEKDNCKFDNENTYDKKVKKGKKKKKSKKKSKNRKDKIINSNSSDEIEDEKNKKKSKSNNDTKVTVDSSVLSYAGLYPRFGPQPWYYETSLPVIYPNAGRGFQRERRGRRSRGHPRLNWRTDSLRHSNSLNANFFYNKQYYKYFASLTGQDCNVFDNCSRNSISKTQRFSVSRSRSRSSSRRSRQRRYSGSDSRNRNRSRSRSSSGNKTRSKGRSRSRSRTRSKVRSRSHSKTRSKNRSRSRGRTRSQSHSRTRSRIKSRSRSRTRSKKRSRSRDHNKTRSKVRSGSKIESRSCSSTRSKIRSRSCSRTRSTGRSRSRGKIEKNDSPKKTKNKVKTDSRSRSEGRDKNKSRSRSLSAKSKSQKPIMKKKLRSSSSQSNNESTEKRRSCSWSKSADEKA